MLHVLDYCCFRNMSEQCYFASEDGSVRFQANPITSFMEKFEDIDKALKEYKWREGDALIASFLKNGW